MSYSTWGTSDFEISEDIIKEIAPTELEAFNGLLDECDMDIDGWAKYLQTDSDHYLNDGQDELEEMIALVTFNYSVLREAVMKAKNIDLGLFAPVGDVVDGEDRAYWIVENAMIVNPNIEQSIISSLEHITVVQGG